MGVLSRAILVLLLAGLTGAGIAADPPAPDAAPPVVVVVLSKEAEPYRLTERGLRSTLDRRGATPTTLVMGPNGPPPDSVESAQVLVGVGTEAAAWLHEHAPASAEVVYCMVADPSGAGLDRGRPAHGVVAEIPINEQVSLLRSVIPGAKSVGVLYRTDSGRGSRALDALRKALPSDWTIHAVDLLAHSSLAAAVEALLSRRLDVVWTMPDSAVFDMAAVRTLLADSIRARVPVFGFSVAFVRAGATLGVGIEPEPHGEQTGDLVLRVWEEHERRGHALTKAVTVSPRYQTALNLGVAEQIGVTIPGAMMRQADTVIKGGR